MFSPKYLCKSGCTGDRDPVRAAFIIYFTVKVLEAVRNKFVGTVVDGKMTEEQWAIDIRLSSINSKLNHDD